MPEILMIDDDNELCELLGEYFSAEKMGFSYALDGHAGLGRAAALHPDIIVLDVMLPGMDGYGVLAALKSDPSTASIPVIMLTARGGEADRIRGLDAGADDYLPKPFSLGELVSRIRAVLRRCSSAGRAVTSDLRLDENTLKAWKGGAEISLSGQEFRVLKTLLSSIGRPVSRDELSRAVFGRDALPMERGLDMQMSRLRRKLGPNADGSDCIKSVRGEGYQYIPGQSA